MTERGFRLDEVDFDGVYEGGSILKGADLPFAEGVPWDIKAPQPAVVRLADAGVLHDEVLDAGCGLGENAIFLASRGYRVTGVDGSPVALDTARARAAERGVDVTFLHADVTTMDGVDAKFSTVLDSALYHCLTASQRDAYAAALARVTLPGARLHLFCFADEGNEGFGLPMTVSRDDLREHLGNHWTIRDIELTEYTTALKGEAWAGMGERLHRMGVPMDPADRSKLRTDDQGRIIGRVWYVVADRA
ncbi:class I SAM-dependent methyltransferase [Labedaea rhizosphaerae]|uniref:Methyltransferase family protein n=1 Tax=Labedaea rhizosphaerae TaxID=598644 RepID=A0A4R6SFY6_LABRH|nr:class I SAM-dependent methyltransferase [Labedaea rhizosphaerae]TDP98115.1 methyltransferase family protein [Labedaea rhizosphaerae]